MHHHIKSGHKGSSGKLWVPIPNYKNMTISDTDTDKDTCIKRNHACHIIQGSGGCGFFPVWEGRSFIDHSTCTFFFFFLSGDQLVHCNSTLSGQGSVHSGSANWGDCGPVFPGELYVSLFPWWVPTLCLDSMVSPFWLCWVVGVTDGVSLFSCSLLPPVLLAEWGGGIAQW